MKPTNNSTEEDIVPTTDNKQDETPNGEAESTTPTPPVASGNNGKNETDSGTTEDIPNNALESDVAGTEEKKMRIKILIRRNQQPPSPKQTIRQRLATVTAAPRSPTPPPLFCFFLLLRVRLLLLWWPRKSEGERAVHRPHTHSSFTLSLC
ncbi:mucin-associated surface protein (MASP), putative, partial [Trypanosoma cruzi marinkellei]